MPKPFELAEEALNYMTAKGVFHKDIEWRHLALMLSKNKVTLVPIFIDLTDVYEDK